MRCRLAGLMLVAAVPAQAQAQDVPLIDTEDASLSSVDVRTARGFHPILTIDLRNGDYARGAYDDDDADLRRIPVHLTPAFVVALTPTLFLLGQSSNGLHAPATDERRSPRVWYESNNLLGVAWRPTKELTTAVSYTIKVSPNGVSDTTHEANLSLAYAGDSGLAALRPHGAITRRPKGGGGTYTLVGIGPQRQIGRGDDAPALSLPITLGIGWNDFYAPGSGTRMFGSGGVSIAQPLRLGSAKASLSLDMLALVRDARLRRLDAPRGTTAAIVPLATLSLRSAW